MKPLEHTKLQCIFCDDIRDEAGGKTTIVGWYAGLPVPLPAEGALLIPSLGIVGVLTLPPDLNYNAMKVELLQDENILQSVVMPDQAINDMQVLVDQANKRVLEREVRIAIKMNNLQVSEPCTLRMRVVLNDEEVYSNGLAFERSQSAGA